jgi:hypothetical protein
MWPKSDRLLGESGIEYGIQRFMRDLLDQAVEYSRYLHPPYRLVLLAPCQQSLLDLFPVSLKKGLQILMHAVDSCRSLVPQYLSVGIHHVGSLYHPLHKFRLLSEGSLFGSL